MQRSLKGSNAARDSSEVESRESESESVEMGGRTVPLEAMPRYSSRRWMIVMRRVSWRICYSQYGLSGYLLARIRWGEADLHNVVLLVLLVFGALGGLVAGLVLVGVGGHEALDGD